MRDIPVFCTEFGVATLVLKNIPLKKEAYIHIRDTQAPQTLLKECCDFCAAAGAEKMFAEGHGFLDQYPLYTTVLRMQCPVDRLPMSTASLFPVQETTLEQWREIYNKRMMEVPTAAQLSYLDAKKLAEEGNAYFVHSDGALLGIGVVNGTNVEAVASVVPGCGETVMLALCSVIPGDTATLAVADNNLPALSLYRRLGFVEVAELETWHKII